MKHAEFYDKHKNLVDTAVAIGDRWEQKGRSEAQAGMEPMSLDDFVKWTMRLSKDRIADAILAEMLHEFYMKGYNAGKASA